MALNLDTGRAGYRPHVPDLAAGVTEPFRVRPATAENLPFIAALDEQGRRRSLVAAVRDATLWSYELGGQRAEGRRALRVIERADGRPVGFLVHAGTPLRDAVVRRRV